jgi:endonuclease G
MHHHIVRFALAAAFMAAPAALLAQEQPGEAAEAAAVAPEVLSPEAAEAAETAARVARAEIHTFHCLHGCPSGTASTNDLVVREIYSLSSNDLTKFADWVAYRVTKASIGKGEGRVWKPEPWLGADETLEPADYDAAPVALKIDRGHQAPLASLSGTPQAAETNYLANITPQKSELNQGSWVRLENAERALAKGAGSPTVYVLTGPLYERPIGTLPKADEPHRLPSGYWKVVAVESGGRTRASSFIFEQETPKNANHCDMRRPVAEIEKRALLVLFPRAGRQSFGSLDAELGCRS